ncbi:MAG: hypothetical protein KKG09_02070 [Verrucomicrobia bacterium]|nr:hypothetical protein [Verrucomicrobiota bacterium]MCG2681415.1 hypothetical protein [Kiritimatiellia bacterium]MBU4248315.1 hypothetical protein [Verrucomicrobiota bacterium]MBU4289842.1 hypothetical protein [Verrucomicrobiota bacterium]MBU4429499.1 hypothetical protein [Verrucomicrobiota bacterium]
MNLSSDWHIHSAASCDEACLQIADLVLEAPAQGIQDFGVTDHIHTPCNLPDLAASRRAFLAVRPSPRFHFGVEVSCVSQWELDEIATGRHENPVYGLRDGGPAGGALAIGVTADDLQAHGVEYVVGGAHWPMYVPFERKAVIRDYHRQNMFLATHPLVTIIAHPWWWMGHWQNAQGMYLAEPWFDSFKVIPQSMHAEFADAVITHGKVVEINVQAILFNPQYPEHFRLEYMDYLARLHARGVVFSVGSDCHSAHYDIQHEVPFARAADMLATVGIHDHDLWRLPARKGGKVI